MDKIPPIMWFGMVVFAFGSCTGYVMPALGVIVAVAIVDMLKSL